MFNFFVSLKLTDEDLINKMAAILPLAKFDHAQCALVTSHEGSTMGTRCWNCCTICICEIARVCVCVCVLCDSTL